MDAPPLHTATTATVEAIPYYDLDGATVAIVVIKERFEAHPNGATSRLGDAEIRPVDVPWDEDEPETSSIRYPSDVCLAKPSTDVIVAGSAMGRGRPVVSDLEVLVRVGPVEKKLLVLGPHVWERGLAGVSPSTPEPFESLPLRWEYAYGGSDFTEGEKPLEEPRNPVGCGVARSSSELIGQPAPRIEDPDDLTRSKRTRPAPAGVGPIMRHWEPRRSYVGTIDERWMEERMPLPPLDQDPRFNQAAAPQMVTPHPLRGGENVVVVNMNDQAPLGFELPMLRFGVVSSTSTDGRLAYRPMLDTVILEPNERRFEMTWRSIVRIPRRSRDLDFIEVYEKAVGGLP